MSWNQTCTSKGFLFILLFEELQRRLYWKNTEPISFSRGKLQSHPWPCCREQLSLCCISAPESTGAMKPEISSVTVPQLEPELAMLNTASLSWELEWAVLDCTAKQFKHMTNLNPSVSFLLWALKKWLKNINHQSSPTVTKQTQGINFAILTPNQGKSKQDCLLSGAKPLALGLGSGLVTYKKHDMFFTSRRRKRKITTTKIIFTPDFSVP